jgi:hypothetical protein
MRQLFGALSRDWLGLLTPPQRDAWTAFARNYHRHSGVAWIACARQFDRCPPHVLTPWHRRIIRRWLVGGRPLSGPQAYVKINSRLGRMGRSKLLWPPPLPLPFRPNPVQEVRLRWAAVAANPVAADPVAADVSRRQFNVNPVAPAVHRRPSDQKSPIPNPPLRLELVLQHRVKGDLRLFASAPCSTGWSNMRRPVYLGLLPAPNAGVHDITALYLARFWAPGPNQQVFIRACQHRHGWEGAPQDCRARVPSQPVPLPPPVPNDQLPIGPRRFPFSILHPPSSILVGCRSAALPLCLSPLPPRRLGVHPSWTSSVLPLGTHCPHPPCTRGTRFLACHRRQSHCRELWRGT